MIFEQYIFTFLGNTNDLIMMVSFFNDILQVFQHCTVNYHIIVTIIQKRDNKVKDECKKGSNNESNNKFSFFFN